MRNKGAEPISAGREVDPLVFAPFNCVKRLVGPFHAAVEVTEDPVEGREVTAEYVVSPHEAVSVVIEEKRLVLDVLVASTTCCA